MHDAAGVDHLYITTPFENTVRFAGKDGARVCCEGLCFDFKRVVAQLVLGTVHQIQRGQDLTATYPITQATGLFVVCLPRVSAACSHLYRVNTEIGLATGQSVAVRPHASDSGCHIAGTVEVALGRNYMCITCYSDGTNWYVQT